MLRLQSLQTGALLLILRIILLAKCSIYEKNVGKGRVTVKTTPVAKGNAFVLSAAVEAACSNNLQIHSFLCYSFHDVITNHY